MDDEIKGEGNSVNYKYRMHDPRVGRFFAVDPKVRIYPFYSPYQFSGNSTIVGIELEGLEPAVILNYTEGSLVIVEGKVQAVDLHNIHYNRYVGETNLPHTAVPSAGQFYQVFCEDCGQYDGKKGGKYYLVKVEGYEIVEDYAEYQKENMHVEEEGDMSLTGDDKNHHFQQDGDPFREDGDAGDDEDDDDDDDEPTHKGKTFRSLTLDAHDNFADKTTWN